MDVTGGTRRSRASRGRHISSIGGTCGHRRRCLTASCSPSRYPIPPRPVALPHFVMLQLMATRQSRRDSFPCIGCRGGRGASATRAQTCRWLPTRRTPPSRSCRNGRARAYSCRRSATCRCAGGSASPNSLPHLRADCRLPAASRRSRACAHARARGSDGALVPLRYYVHASDVLKAELLHSLADHVCFQSGTRPVPAGRLRPLVGRVAFVRTS